MALLNLRWCAESAHIAGCPAVVNADSGMLIICGTTADAVVALTGDGKERWRVSVRGSVSAWPAIDEVPGYGLGILVGTERGQVLCVSPSGQIRWQVDLEAALTPFNNVAVLRGAQKAHVVATDRLGRVIGLGRDGGFVWQFHTHVRGVGPAAIGDIDRDGTDEIVFTAGDGHIYCLDADGAFRWNVRCGKDSEYSAPVLADFGNGPCVLAGSTDDLVRCISPHGEVLWTMRGVGAGYIECGLSLGDMNGDGVDELVFVHQGRAIQVADGYGELLWSTIRYGGGDQAFGPSIGDVNGDGVPELILGQRRGPRVRVLSHEGALLEEHNVAGGMFGAPVIADIDGDGFLEVLMVSMQNGELTCFGTQARARAEAVPWPTSRGGFDGRANRLGPLEVPTTKRTPQTPGPARMHRTSPDTFRLGINHVAFAVDKHEDCLVDLCLSGPDGIEHRVLTDSAKRKSAALEALMPGPYGLKAIALERTRHQPLGEYAESVQVGLFSDERKRAARLLDELGLIVLEAGDLSREIERSYRLKRALWLEIENRTPAFEALAKPARRLLIQEVSRMLALLRREVTCQRLRVEMTRRLGRPIEFLPWLPEHPWAAFAPEETAPPDIPLEAIDVTTDERGHEAVVVELGSLLAQSVDVRAWLDELTGGTRSYRVADHLVLRQVAWVPVPAGDREETVSSRMGADALPDLGEAGIMRLAPWANARLWIDVLTKDLPPGSYSTTLHLRALTSAGATWDIPIHWTVTDCRLPEVMPLHFCNWGYVRSSQLKQNAEVALEDMQDHYTSVFVLSGPDMPVVRYDAKGRLVGKVDWSGHDWLLKRMRPQNVLLFGMPLSPTDGAPGYWSEAWQRAARTFLPRWVKHLAAKGFGYRRWAFYPVDEPGLNAGSDIDELERFARFVKGIDPNVQIYTDPYRGFTVEDYRRLNDVLDILQPAYHIVTSENPDRISHLKTLTDKTRWIYEAQAGVKDMVPPTVYYWGEIWTAWEVGFTGIGYWTYCTTGHDMWSANADYVMVYTGQSAPVPSVRWQAIRIGIEDYARLSMLREAIGEARKAGKGLEADHAEQRMGEIVAEARRSSWDPALLARFRRELVTLTLGLR